MLVSCFEHNTTAAGQGRSAVAEAIWRQMQALGVFANLGSSQYATGWIEAVWLNPEPKQPRSTVHCDVCAIDWSTCVLPEVLLHVVHIEGIL